MIDSVPLIQNANDAQQINASIIAMKKASRELDEKIVKLNSLNSELDKKIALLDSGLSKEIEDRKEAINSLDVPGVGGSGKYISAISETDGKISATEGEITSSVSSGNSQPVTSGGVASALASYDKFEFIQTDATDKIYKLGTTTNATVFQAFTNIYMRGGRVDGVFGEGFITLYGNQYVQSRLLMNLDAIEIIVTLENGQMTVYAKISSWSTLLFNTAFSNFYIDIQEVSQISGTVIWNNTWETVVTFSHLGTMRSDSSAIEKRIYIANSYSIGTVYYYHTGQDSYAFNYRVVAGVVTSIGWLSTSNVDSNIAVSYNSTDGYLSVYSTSNVIAQVVVTGTALIKIE